MSISLKGDQKIRSVTATKSKENRIKLNRENDGKLAEIGDGKETGRNFFREGGA